MIPAATAIGGESEWVEVEKGWAYQRRRHMLISTQWSPRWLVLYSKPMPALAVYEQKSDARPPYTPILHLDLASIKAEEKLDSRSSGTSSLAHSRCASVSEVSIAEGKSGKSKWTDKLLTRLDSVRQQLKSGDKQQQPSSKQALEDHMIVLTKESGEKWTFGFETAADRDSWIRAIFQLQGEIALSKQLEGMELNESEGAADSRRPSQQPTVPVGLQAYGVTVVQEHNMQALLSSTPPEFTELLLEDPKLSKISINDGAQKGGRGGGNDDLNQLYQLLLSERRSKRGGDSDQDHVNDLAILKLTGAFNQMVGKKVQEHIDQYHHQPAALDGLLFELQGGTVQVELVVQYDEGPMEREVAFGNSVVRHELHSLQMINEQRDIPVFSTLMTVMEYKGFRVLAYWALPLSTDTLMLREVEGDAMIVTEPAVQLCRNLASHFNFMQDYPNKINGRPTCLHTGVEVHAIDSDLVKLTGELAARARLMPRGFYLTAMSDMLPQYTLDQQDPVPKRLRPEFVKLYTQTTGQTLPNADNYSDKTNTAVKHLMGPVIENLLKDLENLSCLPVDSIEWTTTLHSRGINIALLGEIYKRTQLPHVKEHMIVEMATRSFKSIIADQLRIAIRHFRQVQALKVEQELRSIALEWIEQLVVQQRGRWIDELLIPLIEVKYKVKLESEVFRQLPKHVLFYAMQYHAGLLMADKEYDLSSFDASDFTGFRIKEVSSSFKLSPIEANERDAAMYNIGLLTLPLSSTTLWRDLLQRAELARRLEDCGMVSSDQKLLTMAENVAPKSHVIQGLVKLRQIGRNKQPICSTSAARSALSDIIKASKEAQDIARMHLGDHHPILIQIRQEEYQLLQKLLDRLKISSTSKGNPAKEIMEETLSCRQAALSTSIRVLGRSHTVTKTLIESIGSLHQSIGNFDDAINFFQEALKIAHRADNSIERVKLLINISKCYQRKGELETALSFAQDARLNLEEREREGTLSSDESVTFDNCYHLIAELALSIITNGESNIFESWDEQQVMSTQLLSFIALAADAYEQLYERTRSHPDRIDADDAVKFLRKIVALRLHLARPAQKTLVKAARRLPTQQSDQVRCKDLLLRMATATSATLFTDRILDAAEQNPTSNGMEELRLLVIIALSDA